MMLPVTFLDLTASTKRHDESQSDDEPTDVGSIGNSSTSRVAEGTHAIDDLESKPDADESPGRNVDGEKADQRGNEFVRKEHDVSCHYTGDGAGSSQAGDDARRKILVEEDMDQRS